MVILLPTFYIDRSAVNLQLTLIGRILNVDYLVNEVRTEGMRMKRFTSPVFSQHE